MKEKINLKNDDKDKHVSQRLERERENCVVGWVRGTVRPGQALARRLDEGLH